MSEPLLRVSDLCVEFALARGTLRAVDGASFEVGRGQALGLVGESGAGKTVALRALVGLLPRSARITGGSIEFDGARIDRLTPNELVRIGVCQVMEGRHCFQHLTVEENLLTGAFTRSIKRTELAADLDLVYRYFPRLRERRSSLAGYTSGG